jgi:hypothetical protein
MHALGQGFMTATVIHEYFVVKNFRFVQSDKNFLCEIIYLYKPIQRIYAWRAIDMYKNIVTRIFVTQNFCKRN